MTLPVKVSSLFLMIICMCNIICVTNRSLCKEDFLTRIEKLAKENLTGIILREKDLSDEAYFELAKETMAICEKYNAQLILHSFVEVAIKLGCKSIHLSLPILKSLSLEQKQSFDCIGASCHSVEDATQCEKLGCSYITVGHIYETDCKKGLPGRGISLLREVCEAVSIPVYAIGGINASNITEVIANKADGACIMSGLMVCEDVRSYLEELFRN